MKHALQEKLIKQAQIHFYQDQYERALQCYSRILSLVPNHKEARICALISHLALSYKNEAVVIFDFYLVLKNQQEPNAEQIIEDILDDIEATSTLALSINGTLKRTIFEDGINLKEFKQILSLGKNFKDVFEAIIFSTRLIIKNEDDFMQLLQLLEDNGYKDMAIKYIESYIRQYPFSTKTQVFIEHLK